MDLSVVQYFYWDFKIFNYIWPALRTGVCKLLNS